MHSILFSLTKSDARGHAGYTWKDVVDEINRIAPPTSEVDIVGEGVWLIHGANGLTLLGNATLVQAKRYEFAFRVLLIHEATEWTPETTVGENPNFTAHSAALLAGNRGNFVYKSPN